MHLLVGRSEIMVIVVFSQTIKCLHGLGSSYQTLNFIVVRQ